MKVKGGRLKDRFAGIYSAELPPSLTVPVDESWDLGPQLHLMQLHPYLT